MKIKIAHLGFWSFQLPAPLPPLPPPPLTQFQALKLLSLTLKISLRPCGCQWGGVPSGRVGSGCDKCQKVFTPTVCRGKVWRKKERKLKRNINGKKTWSRANWLDCDTLRPTHTERFLSAMNPGPPLQPYHAAYAHYFKQALRNSMCVCRFFVALQCLKII